MVDPDLTIEGLPPLPPGAPPDFRERLVLALKTTDADRLARAESAFRGTYASVHIYIAEQLAEHLPPGMTWILAAADPARLQAGYQGLALQVWAIPAPDGRALVFESVREDPPCPVCGAEFWDHFRFSDDMTPIGCDACAPP